jgi:hypothetical protein
MAVMNVGDLVEIRQVAYPEIDLIIVCDLPDSMFDWNMDSK